MNGDAETILEPTEHLQNLLEKCAKSEEYKKYDFEIVSQFGKGENYLGEIRRAVINGVRQDDTKEKLDLIIKTSPPYLHNRKDFNVKTFYDREIYSYKQLLKTLVELQNKYEICDKEQFKCAKCYICFSEEDHSLVFEDLNAKGYKMYDRLSSLDKDHLELSVKTLARFHALSFAAKEKLPDVYDEFKKHVTTKEDMGKSFKNYLEEMIEVIKTYLADDLIENFKKFCEEEDLLEKFNRYVNLQPLSEGVKEDPYYIVTHGDTWVNNMLFKYQNGKPSEVILLDWQITKYCSPVTDLVYLIFCCTDIDDSNGSIDDIFTFYYDSIRSRLLELACDPDKCYPEEAYRRDLKDYIGFGLLMAIGVVPLVLNNREESVNLSDMLDEDGFKPSPIRQSEKCINRIQSVVRYFKNIGAI